MVRYTGTEVRDVGECWCVFFFKQKTAYEVLRSLVGSEMCIRDSIKYGLIPELVGRIPVVSAFSELDLEDLAAILTRPKNALIKQYQKLFEMEGVDLEFTDEALVAIAQKSVARKLGARGLRSIIEDLMLDLMFDLPTSKKNGRIKITKRMVEENELAFDRPRKPSPGA